MNKIKHYYEAEPVSIPETKPTVLDFSTITDWSFISNGYFNKYGNRKDEKWHTETSRLRVYKGEFNRPYKVKVCNISIAFDTETTTVMTEQDNRIVSAKGYVYIWQVAIDNTVIIGRKLDDFYTLLDKISEQLQLGEYGTTKKQQKNSVTPFDPLAHNGVIVYEARMWVANLGFEFQFIRKRIDVKEVFAAHTQHPMTVTTGKYILMQDALEITGSSLAKIPDLYNLPTKKLKGDLDYSKMRNSLTPLTNKELQYCINDVVILREFNEYLVETYVKRGLKIPLTKTGMLRDSVVKKAKEYLKQGNFADVVKRNALLDLFPETFDDFFKMQSRLFRGGYTHANVDFVNEPLTKVNGVDFTSSYPAVLLQCLFPMSKFVDVTYKFNSVEDVLKLIGKTHCCKGTFKFKKLRPTTSHSIESVSKTFEYFENGKNARKAERAGGFIIDNGRVRQAETMTVMLTDVDLRTYQMFYTWESVEISELQIAAYGRLPDYLLDCVIYYYQIKDAYKKAGKEDTVEYKLAKAMVNAAYGMMCEHLHLEEISYNNGWETMQLPADADERQALYEKEIFGKEGRKGCYSSQSAMPAKFLSPYWGVWCTAHARYRLLEMVYKIDEDVVYCDTDSIYMVNYDKHADDIKAWNDYIRVANQTWVNNTNAKRVQDNATAINQFQSDNNATPAQVKEFVFSQKWWVPYENFEDLGEFDKLNKQGDYTRFKVMGAKRYIKESWDYKSDKDKEEPDQLKYHFEQTIAGLPKGVLSKYATKLGKSPFEMFSNEMVIPKEYSAKNGHVYNDEPHYDTITDEFGNTETMVSDSSVGIYPTSFSMTMTSDFLELIETVKLSRPIDYERGEYL